MRLFERKNVEYKSWHSVVLIGVIIFAVGLGIKQKLDKTNVYSGRIIETFLNEETCMAAGGAWTDSCKCVNNEQCPFGFKCGEITNGVGICLDSSSN